MLAIQLHYGDIYVFSQGLRNNSPVPAEYSKQLYEEDLSGWSANGKRCGGSYISVVASTLYNTNTRTIKLNKGTGYFAFHLLGTGSRDRAPGNTPRINLEFSYF